MVVELLPVPPFTRRSFLIGGGGVTVAALTACSRARDEPAGSTTAGYPRTVTDGTGAEVVIPDRPRRIAVGQNVWDLNAVLALGIAPVQFGLRDFSEYTGSPTTSWPWHEEALAGLGDAGAAAERIPVGEGPDIEVISRARPDLVIGDDFLADARGQLESLCPVVQITAFDWRANLRLVGEVMDVSDQAEELIASTDAVLASALDDYALQGATVAVLAVYDATSFYVFGHPSIPAVDLFTRAGFGLVDDLTAGATAEEPRVEYGIEELGRVAPADVVVVFDYSSGDAITALSALSLYTDLPAVAAGRVVVVPQGEQAQGLSVFGPLDVDLGLDLVRRTADLLG
jgi:iron complex transport system substrate-binding protein